MSRFKCWSLSNSNAFSINDINFLILLCRYENKDETKKNSRALTSFISGLNTTLNVLDSARRSFNKNAFLFGILSAVISELSASSSCEARSQYRKVYFVRTANGDGRELADRLRQ